MITKNKSFQVGDTGPGFIQRKSDSSKLLLISSAFCQYEQIKSFRVGFTN
jgi:hypothetical protein